MNERSEPGMSIRMRERAPRSWPQRLHLLAAIPLALALGLGVGGCDSILEVSTPGAVAEEDLNDPQLAETLVNSALGRFECAVTQYGIATGVLAWEFWTSSNFRVMNAWSQRIDGARESGGGCSTSRGSVGMSAFFALQQARTQSEDAYERISTFSDADVPNKLEKLGTLTAYSAYAYTLLGEGFCEMTLDGGPRMPPEDILAIAEERFTQALEYAGMTGDADMRNMALVGRARVRLNLGMYDQAAADAAQVPEGYTRYAEHSTAAGIRENRIWGVNNFAGAVSVTDEYRNLEVDGVPDPRVPVTDAGRAGQDGVTALWVQEKFTSASSWTPIASWREAQLIVAEVEGGQVAVDIINRLRDEWDLPHFQSDDPDEILEQVIEERRRVLFAEGHRLNDKLRHNIPFPGPTDHQGATFGPMTCMFLPWVETQNNPNL
jgi:starch-binding outer membrane protein, SusD/RagB family